MNEIGWIGGSVGVLLVTIIAAAKLHRRLRGWPFLLLVASLLIEATATLLYYAGWVILTKGTMSLTADQQQQHEISEILLVVYNIGRVIGFVVAPVSLLLLANQLAREDLLASNKAREDSHP